MRGILLIVLLLAAWVSGPGFAQGAGRDVPKVVAVGDLHGDYEAWLEIARQSGIADRTGRWAGGDTVLVQLGDMTDRGPDSLKIIQHLQELAKEAGTAGGQVIVLLGNHEAMNVIGDLRYVHPGEYEAFRDRRSERRREGTWKANRELLEAFYRQQNPELSSEQIKQLWLSETPLGKLEHRRAWRAGGDLGQWAATLPAVARIGRSLFVHGGLSEEATREPIDSINRRHGAALQPGSESAPELLYDPLGPLWYRGNVRRPPAHNAAKEGEESDAEEGPPSRLSREDELDEVLKRYSADRLVVAHTPSIDGIRTEFGGRLLRVDTGISRHYGGPTSFLVIEGDRVEAHQRAADGSWEVKVLESPQAGVERW